MSWIHFFSAALSGGFVVKILDLLYSEFSRKREKTTSAKQVVAKHIDPILKSADQLLGQFISLAKNDFRPLFSQNETNEIEVEYTMYLIANFWACLLVLEKDSIHVDLAERKEGRHLLRFISTLKAKRNRLLSRAEQQVIGESIIEENNRGLKIKSFYDFLDAYKNPKTSFNLWFNPLRSLLEHSKSRAIRQHILLYGVILHAMVDNLDAGHHYVRDRKSYPNKLTRRSRNDIKNRIFGVYLDGIKDNAKYWKI